MVLDSGLRTLDDGKHHAVGALLIKLVSLGPMLLSEVS